MADDFSELSSLAADLTHLPDTVNPFVEKAIEVTARNVKEDWQQAANRTGLAGYASDVDYDIKAATGSIGAEIGPTPGDSGSFGFVEEGGGNVRSAPQHAGRDALRANEDDFVRGLEIAVFDATVKGLT